MCGDGERNPICMSIHFISGKPGGGKTLYSVRLIMDELIRGDRLVVTNVSLKLGEVNKYLQDKAPSSYERRLELDKYAHITDRVLLIGEDELGKFFTFRGGGVRLNSVTNEEWKSGKRPNYKLVQDRGVFYVLDEVHIAFNSRTWATTGAEVLYYLSQHRKLGDDVVCITQSVGNVDKQFRSVAQDFTYIKNLGKQRAGLFRLPSVFTRSTYLQPATDTSHAMESGTFQLDVSGLASCYDTAQGVGIHGRSGADTKERKKGLHWLWFAVGAPIAAFLVFHMVPRIMASVLAPHVEVRQSVAVVKPQAVALLNPAVASPLVVTQYVRPVERAVTQRNWEPTNDLYCTGYFGAGKDLVLFLSDGSSVDTASGRVQTVATTYVVVDNRRLAIKRAHVVYVEPAKKEHVGEPTLIDAPLQSEPGLPFGGITVTPSVGGSR